MPLTHPVSDPPPPVEALLLAAGRGERLRPLTDVVPKPVIPLPGAPLGAWMLEPLLSQFGSVVVNCSHLASEVMAQLALEGRASALIEEPEPFGTGGTLAVIRDLVADRIVVANADVISDCDIPALLETHVASGAEATVAVNRVESAADFSLDGGSITGFVDRRSRSDSAGARFIGVSVYERAALDRLSGVRPLGLGESLLSSLASERALGAYIHDRYAADVGTLRSYVDTCNDVLRGVAPPPPQGPYEEFRGEFIEVEEGRAFVAKSARCKETSLGPGAVILSRSSVPSSARIRNAVVWSGESVLENADVEDSIQFKGHSLTLN